MRAAVSIASALFVAVAGVGAAQQPRALLVEPGATTDYYRSVGSAVNTAAAADAWETRLARAQVRLARAGEQALTALESVDFVVLPGALILSDVQLDSLLAYLENGGAVLMTGATGARKSDGSWRGYDMLTSMLGAAPPPANSSSRRSRPASCRSAGALPGSGRGLPRFTRIR